MKEHLFFYIGLCFILIHEMDAVRLKEWQIFPGLSLLKEETGYFVFTILHIPLYFLLFKGLQNIETSQRFIWCLDVFFAVHILLHVLFLKHKKNPFKSLFSWSIIIAAGLFGLIDLFIGF